MTIATRGQTVGLDSTDNQTNVQVSTYFYYNLFNYLKIKLFLFVSLECFPTEYTNAQCVIKY